MPSLALTTLSYERRKIELEANLDDNRREEFVFGGNKNKRYENP